MMSYQGRSRRRIARAREKLREGWRGAELAVSAIGPELPAPPETLPSAPDDQISPHGPITPEPAAAPPEESPPPLIAADPPVILTRRHFVEASFLTVLGGVSVAGFFANRGRPTSPQALDQPSHSEFPDPFADEPVASEYLASPVPASTRRPEPPVVKGQGLADRVLALYSEITGEFVRATYWSEGDYVLEELESIHKILRDPHVDEMAAIDLKLLEVLHALNVKLEMSEPFHVLSAYRSPFTNERLSHEMDGVAANSFHMKGKAIDLRVPGHSKRQLLRAAISLKAGGVGSYPGYVHVDTGPLRRW